MSTVLDAQRPAPVTVAPKGKGRFDLSGAQTRKALLMIAGGCILQFAFILSYVGALHAPKPHDLSVAVVAPTSVAPELVTRLNGLPSDPVSASAYATTAEARRAVVRGDRSAAFIVDPASKTDTLLIASGGGNSVAQAVQTVFADVDATQQRQITTEDVVPLQTGDGRGLSGFYLVVGWVVGGYLGAVLVGQSFGPRPRSYSKATLRFAWMVPYAVVAGLGGAVIIDSVLGALTGHFLALWGLGTLIVLCVSFVAVAVQSLFGLLGVGVTILLFVVLGNPSAGGVYQPALLPPFWRALSGALPNGAGVDYARRIVYFAGNGIDHDLTVLAIWAVAGLAATYAAIYFADVRGSHHHPGVAPDAEGPEPR